MSEVNLAQQEELKASAVGFGLDVSWVTDVLQKYGQEVLSLVVEALRSGFSKDFVTDVVTKFGPMVLQLLVNVFNKKKMMAAEPVIQADEVGVIDISVIKTLIETYLPVIFQKYGDQIVQFVVNWIANNLFKKN